MTQRAATNVELDDLHEVLVGPTAVAFSKDDVIAPAKIINNFAKDHDALEIKGGVIDGELASIEQIKERSEERRVGKECGARRAAGNDSEKRRSQHREGRVEGDG